MRLFSRQPKLDVEEPGRPVLVAALTVAMFLFLTALALQGIGLVEW